MGDWSINCRFGENLKRTRHAAGAISQEELADRAGLHRTEISLLERGGRSPRLGTIVRLASALEVPAGELLHGMAWRLLGPRSGRFETGLQIGSKGNGRMAHGPRHLGPEPIDGRGGQGGAELIDAFVRGASSR